MTGQVSNVEIEDVLSSIRRLVSTDVKAVGRRPLAHPDGGSDALVLTPSQRVPDEQNLFADADAAQGEDEADMSQDMQDSSKPLEDDAQVDDVLQLDAPLGSDFEGDVADAEYLEDDATGENADDDAQDQFEDESTERVQATVPQFAALQISPVSVIEEDQLESDKDDPSAFGSQAPTDTTDELKARIAELEALLRSRGETETVEVPDVESGDRGSLSDEADWEVHSVQHGLEAEPGTEQDQAFDGDQSDDPQELSAWSDVLEARAETLDVDDSVADTADDGQAGLAETHEDNAPDSGAIVEEDPADPAPEDPGSQQTDSGELTEASDEHANPEPSTPDVVFENPEQEHYGEAGHDLSEGEFESPVVVADDVTDLVAETVDDTENAVVTMMSHAEVAENNQGDQNGIGDGTSDPEVQTEDVTSCDEEQSRVNSSEQDAPEFIETLEDDSNRSQAIDKHHDDASDDSELDEVAEGGSPDVSDNASADPEGEILTDEGLAGFSEGINEEGDTRPAFQSVRGRIEETAEHAALDMAAATLLGQELGPDGDDTAFIDEETLRDMVTEIVREELQGALGERITRNVRKLVRREIHRAMVSREFE